MRRSDKEIRDKQALEDILNRAEVLHLGMRDENEMFIFPLNYAYRENSLYIHSAPDGQKISILRENPEVCFTVEVDVELLAAPLACAWGMRYRSVMGKGKAVIIHDKALKKAGLDIIMQKHTRSSHIHNDYHADVLDRVCLIRVDISEMTGKASG